MMEMHTTVTQFRVVLMIFPVSYALFKVPATSAEEAQAILLVVYPNVCLHSSAFVTVE
jgi:hypothetical protein